MKVTRDAYNAILMQLKENIAQESKYHIRLGRLTFTQNYHGDLIYWDSAAVNKGWWPVRIVDNLHPVELF